MIGLLTVVPLLTLVALKFHEKRRLKAARRAAELHRGQQPEPEAEPEAHCHRRCCGRGVSNSVAVVQVPPPVPADGETLVDDVSDAEVEGLQTKAPLVEEDAPPDGVERAERRPAELVNYF